MKKYIIVVCFINSLNCMEQSSPEKIEITKKIRKSHCNIAASDKANIVADNFFLQCLQDCKIDTKNKTILDVSSRTGNIDAELAGTAVHVRGFNDNKDKIKFAQNKHGNIENISFEYFKIKETKIFKSNKKYELALDHF